MIAAIYARKKRGDSMKPESTLYHPKYRNAQGAWVRSPWQAVQRAAADALRKREAPEAAPRDWTTTDESPR